MNCQECGRPVSEGSKFCKACGAPVRGAVPTGQGTLVANECPFCKAPLKPNARFCAACGGGLAPGITAGGSTTPHCPSCGKPVKSGKRFCGTCGATIVTARSDGSAQGALLSPGRGPSQDPQKAQQLGAGVPSEQPRPEARSAAPPVTDEKGRTAPVQPMTPRMPMSPPLTVIKGSPEQEPQGPPMKSRQPESLSPEPPAVRPTAPSRPSAAQDLLGITQADAASVPPQRGNAPSRRLIMILAAAGGILVIGIATVALLLFFGIFSPHSGHPSPPLSPESGGSSPPQANSPGQASPPPEAPNPADMQKRAMGEIRNIATACQSYATDHRQYPSWGQGQSPQDRWIEVSRLAPALAPAYIKQLPTTDPWGQPYWYAVGRAGRDFAVLSSGSDGVVQASRISLDVTTTQCFESDIIWMDDAFHQRPDGPQRACSPASEASRASDFPIAAGDIFPESLAEKASVRPKAPPRPKFVDVTELDSKPTPQAAPKFTYTDQAIDAQVKGTVVLEVSIDETGRVTDCTMVQGPTPDYGMDQACLDAAKNLVFSVPTRKGMPAKTRVLLPMVLDPPPKPKPAPVQNLTSLGVIIEAKANLGRFQLLVDQKVAWESSLMGSLGETKRQTKELQLPAGPHQVELLAWMPNATKPFGTSGTYSGAAGEHHVVKYYVTIFGNIKGEMVQ